MNQGKKGQNSTKKELLKELEELREQARKAALLEAENKALKDSLENSEREIEKLKYLLFEANYTIQQWKKRFFGSSKERFVSTLADQLVLELELTALPAPADDEIIKVEYIRKQANPELTKKPSRMILPDHLSREVIDIYPEGDLSGLTLIGTQVTERLEITPQRFKVIREVRYKYVDPKNKGKIIMPPLPERAIFKGMAGPALTADMMVGKFIDGLPITRQISRFARQGVSLAKSTVNGWFKNTCEFLEPLLQLHTSQVRSSPYQQVDETHMPVLDRSKEKGIRRSYHWVYYSPPDNIVLFDFQPGRDKSAPQQYLKNFKGILQTDNYAGYNQFDRPGVVMLGCMAHARRKFSDAQDSDPMARIALAEFQQLYAVEHNAKLNHLNTESIQIERAGKSAAILNRLKTWVENYWPKTTPTSPMGKAISYFLKNWKKLTAYIGNGQTLIDNNPVERCIRPLTVGRNNYLFAGSHEGGCWAAMMYSFFGTCKLHKINPMEWLTDVLTRMPDYPKLKLDELLPQNWKPTPAF
jgi:transposase